MYSIDILSHSATNMIKFASLDHIETSQWIKFLVVRGW